MLPLLLLCRPGCLPCLGPAPPAPQPQPSAPAHCPGCRSRRRPAPAPCPGKRGTLPPGPETGTGRDVTPPPYAYMPGPGTTSKNSSISLLFSAGFRLEITPLPFFPQKIFKPKIRPGRSSAMVQTRISGRAYLLAISAAECPFSKSVFAGNVDFPISGKISVTLCRDVPLASGHIAWSFADTSRHQKVGGSPVIVQPARSHATCYAVHAWPGGQTSLP